MPNGKDSRPYASLPVIIVMLVLMTLVIGFVALQKVEQHLIAATGESLALAAVDVADKLDRILYERYGDIQIMAREHVFQRRDAAAKITFLQTIKAAYRYYIWLGVTDARGRIVAATDRDSIGKDRSRMGWFKTVRERGGIQVQDAQPSEDSGGVMAIAFTAPILGPRGEFLGTVTSRVSLPVMEEDVLKQIVEALQIRPGPGSRIECQFLNSDGDIIADSVLYPEDQVNLKLLGLPSALLSASTQPGYIEEQHLRRHVSVVTGYASTKGYGQFSGLHWAVLVRMDRSDILAPIHAVLWKLGAAGFFVFVPMLGFLIWTTVRLRKEWASAREESTRAISAEASMHESEARTRLIVNTALDAVIVMDGEGVVKDWNPMAESIFGWSREEAVGHLLSEMVIPPQYREAHTKGLKHYLATGEGPLLNKRIEITACHRDGHEFPVELAISPLRSGEAVTFSGFVRDITERKRAEEALEKSRSEIEKNHEALRALTAQLFTAQEEERRRIARDLHDDVNQRLAAMALRLENLERALPSAPDLIREELRMIGTQVAHLSDDVHGLAYALHPMVLDELGLEVALRAYVENFAAQEGTKASFIARALPDSIPRHVTTCLYRVAQEALRNVGAHARAAEVTVTIEGVEGAIMLCIADSGIGFDPIQESRKKRSLGLVSMEERVRQVNGAFSLRSRSGEGTQVFVRVPLVVETP
jgi:PAS domain S-box-containing protein